MTKHIDLKKLYYQGTHRGMREVDMILTPLMERLGSFSHTELLAMDAFLQENDQTILAWVMGATKAPTPYMFIIAILQNKP